MGSRDTAMLKLVLFDVDGTLIDSQHIIVEAQRRAFASVGLPAPSRADSLSIVGLSLREAFAVLVGPDGPIEALADAYKSAFGELRLNPSNDAPFFPGAQEIVARLTARDDVLLGVATGKSRRGVAHLVERAGWHGVLSTIQTADDNPSKPAPDMILKALAETGVDPAHAVLVGDTSFDMIMARDAGIAAIGVDWGYHPTADLRDAGAHVIAHDFDEVLHWIDRIPGLRDMEPAHG